METVDKKIEKLKEIIDASENVVFLAEPVCRRKAESRISEAWMVCTTRNINIRRKQLSAIVFICGIRKNFTGFIRIK